MGRLDEVDLGLKLKKSEQNEKLEELGDRLQDLRLRCAGLRGSEKLGKPVCVLFEGWDASGKGGAIKRLVNPFDLRHVRVRQYEAPTADEKRHHFLDRFVPALPGWGGLTVLDRSWYGRVLVERVEGFATKAEVARAYDEINAFENLHVAEGMVLVKLWMHISDAEQLDRFERRKNKPLKRWKLTDEDWRNREKRPQYERAVEDMLARTDTEWAPWTVVPAESKRYARVFVMARVIEAMEQALRGRSSARR
jgi:polyphosphate kinase 2 (PPK2 family)